MAGTEEGRKIIVRGRVQGVGYRYYTQKHARALGLTGTVRNLANGDVEVVVAGTADVLNQFVGLLKKGPMFSHVDELTCELLERAPAEQSFYVVY